MDISRLTSFWNQVVINFKNITPLQIATIVTGIVLAVIILRLILMFILGFKYSKKEMRSDIEKKINSSVKDKNAYRLFLSQNGIMYRFHNYDMEPATYYFSKWAISVFIGIFVYLITFSIIIAALVTIALTLLMDRIFVSFSKDDYKEMQMDLYKTYMSLKNQLRAGVYINTTLTYVRNNVANVRYKEALSELILNLSSKDLSTDEAVQIFKDRFKSAQIDSLCSMLDSYFAYGFSPQLLNSLTSQIASTLKADSTKEQDYVDNKVSIIAVALIGIAILLILYAVAINAQDMQIFGF